MNMRFNKKIFINLFLTIFFSIIVYILITKKIIYPTIVPMLNNGILNIFVDWSVILSANLCQDRVDVYISNPCDFWNRAHVYGEILLNIPFIKNFLKFYYLVFPIIINFLFLYVLISFFKFKNYIEFLTILPFVFSIPVLLVIERGNIDNIIFLLIFFISLNKNLFSNYFFIIVATLIKFYPVVSVIIFLYKKNLKKILINFFLLILIVISILFFEIDSLKKIFENSKQFASTPHLSFSLIGFINHLNNLQIVFKGNDFNWIKFIFIFVVLVIPLIFTIFLTAKTIFSDEQIKNLFINNNFENRIYILSSTVLLFCYFAFSNFIYREIFFLGLIPWIINIKKLNNISSFFNFYYYALCGKFFLSTILIYLYRNHLTLFKPVATITKHCLDFYLIFIVLMIFVSALISLIKVLLKNQVPQNV